MRLLWKSAIVVAFCLLGAAPSTAQRNGPPNGAPNGQPNGSANGQPSNGSPNGQPNGSANGQPSNGSPNGQPNGSANGQPSNGSPNGQPNGSPNGQPSNGSPNGQPNGANVIEVIHTNFGSVLEPVAPVKPFYLIGDLNGDRIEDLIIVVRINGLRSSLPKDVRLLNPFDAERKINYPAAKENKFGLAIIHSWKRPQPTGKFLLIGDSPILILENSRPTSGPDAGDMKLMLRNARRRPGEVYPKTAKGDIVVMGTEVGGDSKLYWNGTTYVWEDSPDD